MMRAQWPYADEAPGALLDIDISEDMEREFSPRKERHMPNVDYDPSNAKATAPRVSPFDELARAVDQIKDLQSQVAELSDRIAGSVPRAVGEPDASRSANGLIDIVDIAASTIREISVEIREDIARISRRL